MFVKRFGWSLLPKTLHELEPVLHTLELQDEFRWLREGRQSSRCPSFVNAQRLVHVFCSPIDICLSPSDQFTFDCEFNDLAQFQKDTGTNEVWRRNGKFIGICKASGLKKFDFRVGEKWESMFLPNGENSWEWRLGLNFDVPVDCSVLVFDEPTLPSIEIVPGVFSNKQILSMNENSGISIAFRVKQTVYLKRGTPIARCVALGN